MVYLTNTWTIFLKLVYIPVHPGFIDILSFELECHPSNAPEKVEEGIIIVNPHFFFFFPWSERQQTPSRLSLELVFLNLLLKIYTAYCWSKTGVVGRGVSLFPVSKQKCLSLFFLFFLYCNSLCLTVSFLDLLMLVLPSAKSHLKCPLSKSYSSLSNRSTVSIVYLILFTTLTNWISISYLFISPNIMSTPREQWPWLSFTTICPYSLIQCLVHNNNNYAHSSWTFKIANS